MPTREEYQERYQDEELLFADGLDDAILGISDAFGAVRVIYSVSKVLDILQDRDDMPYEEAREFFDFNIGGAWVGDHTPIWCEDGD